MVGGADIIPRLMAPIPSEQNELEYGVSTNENKFGLTFKQEYVTMDQKFVDRLSEIMVLT